MATSNPTAQHTRAERREGQRHRQRWMNYARIEFSMQHGVDQWQVFNRVATAIGVPFPRTTNEGWGILETFYHHDPKHRNETMQPVREKRKKRHKARHAAKAKTPKGVLVNSDKFLSSFEWRQLRMIVLKKRGTKCECCGNGPHTGFAINVDHIKPRRRYPELALVESNLQVLCEVCNHGKGSWDETDWRAVSQRASESLESPVTGAGDGDGQMPVVQRPRLVRGDVKRASGE